MSASSLTRFNRVGFRRRLIAGLWQALPAISVFVLMLPAGLPKHASTVSDILPSLPLLAIFYWGLVRPNRLGFSMVFIAGLIEDTLMSTPFASTALLWVLFRYVVMMQRKELAEQGFIVQWIYCGMLLLGVSVLQWIIMGYFAGRALPVLPSFMQCLLGVLLFPALHVVLYRIEHLFYRKYWFILQTA